MAKLTLLDIVQDILSDMNSDEVNSIVDTPDSMQVAQIVRSTFFDILDSKDSWPHLRTLFQLDASTDSEKPTHMGLPENVKELQLVKYNKRKVDDTRDKFQEVEYAYPDVFLERVNAYNTAADDVTLVTDYSGVQFAIKNDEAPSFWTSFDDDNLVFNAYDSEVDDTLQASKTQCMATRNPVWEVADEFIPDLPEEAFSQLLAESKSACFYRLKQRQDPSSDLQGARQRRAMSRKSWRAAGGIRFPNWGRVSRK